MLARFQMGQDFGLQLGGDFLGASERHPLCLARFSPALTRSTIRDRSNGANTPHIWNRALSSPC